MTIETKTMTAEDLLRMPRDGFRYELVRGEVVRMAPSGKLHGKLAAKVLVSLARHVESKQLGEVIAAETGFKLASKPDHVRAPDAAFISNQRLEQVGEVEGFWPGAPDLVVEIISPSDTYTAVEEKVFDWLEAGCRMVIVVNSRKRAVTVYRSLKEVQVLSVADVIDGADVVPGWRLPVAELFG
jgi:Uma2 family endonuclease